jgi:hypothetical protein
MPGKAVVSLTTGLEDPEKVTVAFLVAVGAAEQGRPTLMFLTKEAVRLALDGFAYAIACDGCPPLTDLLDRYEKADGRSWSARSASMRESVTRASWSATRSWLGPCRCGSGSAMRGQQPSASEGVAEPDSGVQATSLPAE